MQYVWLYLSIWNTLHQSRYTVLWQRGQCRSPGADPWIYAQRNPLMSFQVLNREVRHASDRSEGQHRKAAPPRRWASGEGATLWLVDGHTVSQRCPPMSSLPLIFTLACTTSHHSNDSAPGEREAARNRKSFCLHQAPSPVSTPANPECD